MVSEKGHLEWKKMYFKLSRCYPHREQYSDTLHFCTHCHILFWKVLLHFMFLTRSKPTWNWNLSQVKREIKKKKSVDCHICFFSQDTNHPCTANNPESCTVSLSPQDFINLFNFWHPSPTNNKKNELIVYTVHTNVQYWFVSRHDYFLDLYLVEVYWGGGGNSGSGTIMQSRVFWKSAEALGRVQAEGWSECGQEEM